MAKKSRAGGEKEMLAEGAKAASRDEGHGRGSRSPDHTRGVPSTAAVAGHPLHPAAIPFPVAFLVAAFGADIGFLGTGDAFWARAALWLTGAGILTGGLAALLGLTDFLTIERARVHRIGWVHALGAGAVLALATVSGLLRLGDPAAAALPWGLALSALTAGLLIVTGWAGGELAYRHMIGVAGHEGSQGAQEHGATHSGTEAGDPGATTSRPSGAHEHPAELERGIDSGGTGQAGMTHGAGSPAYAVTGPQLAAVTGLTLLALAAGVLFSFSYANLTLSARDVGGAVMPPGMIRTRDLSAEAMRDMAAVDLRHAAYTAPADARGDRSLAPRLEGVVKVFDLDVSVIRWNILPDVRVAAYAFNRQVPGPRIEITEGDRVRINVTNHLPEPTTVHWHGLVVPNAMDGPAEITQKPILPGGRFTYEFTARQRGTFFYHSHASADRQEALGMYGALLIDPRDRSNVPDYDRELVVQLQEWTFKEGYTFPAMPMEGAMPNFFTINGKAYPATETVNLRLGERLRIRFIGSSSAFIHPMHIHGGPFQIVEADGQPVPEGGRLFKDTVNVAPGERYDVIWEAREPGKWLLHCHINHHTTNNNREEQGAGGLTMIIRVTS